MLEKAIILRDAHTIKFLLVVGVLLYHPFPDLNVRCGVAEWTE